MALKYANQAIADLLGVRAFIAQDNPEQAMRVAEDIVRVCQLLERFPALGRQGVEPGTREMAAAKSWVVVYETIDTDIFILRVWHGRQSRD